MRIYLATWLAESAHGEAFSKIGHYDRLLSYYFVLRHKITEKGFRKYCRTGRLTLSENKAI